MSPAKARRRKGSENNLSELSVFAGVLSESDPLDMKKSKTKAIDDGEELLAEFKGSAGVVLGVTEERQWIEVFFDGVIMHTETVNLPANRLFTIYVEEIGHKTTIYEHPKSIIYFDGPYDLRVTREGERVMVAGTPNVRVDGESESLPQRR